MPGVTSSVCLGRLTNLERVGGGLPPAGAPQPQPGKDRGDQPEGRWLALWKEGVCGNGRGVGGVGAVGAACVPDTAPWEPKSILGVTSSVVPSQGAGGGRWSWGWVLGSHLEMCVVLGPGARGVAGRAVLGEALGGLWWAAPVRLLPLALCSCA